ncbi:hypothetical protein EV130_110193 [Rhizobium azibense]|uniref:Uncharacterized protein n=1 Tax=Rhizobium azibense TaxID=1136135 RepID=A0A4R3RGD2_9HYPH|nr:hypothetical protein EV130_110193 [Rhizobium azibense]TCU33349.1 hypothetical protein EV129_116107 [Rhizobium azibense]
MASMAQNYAQKEDSKIFFGVIRFLPKPCYNKQWLILLKIWSFPAGA